MINNTGDSIFKFLEHQIKNGQKTSTDFSKGSFKYLVIILGIAIALVARFLI